MATPALGFDNFYTSTLSSGITASDTTIYLNALPTATEGYLVIEPDSSTQREIIYYTSKGANFVTLPSAAAGRGVGATTAQSHSSGVTAQMNVVAEHFEALQDGTAIGTGAITSTKIGDAAVTPEKLLAGTGTSWAWQTYTPTFANTTLGNGTVTGKYIRIGKFVQFYASFKLGTTSAVSSNPTVTLPVTASATAFDTGSGDARIGQTSFEDNGVASYDGITSITATGVSATTAKIIPLGTASTYLGPVAISSTVPFTWGNLDTMRVSGTYESA
jgi:hypothetical protein